MGIIMLGFPLWYNSLHVEVAGDVHVVAVSGKVVPLVHINLVLLIGYNLNYCALHHFSDANIKQIFNSPHTRISSLFSSPELHQN